MPENILFSSGNRRKESSIREYSTGETSSTVSVGTPTIRLFIKKTSKDQATKPEEEGIMVEMKDDDSSVFRYVQDLLLGNQNCKSSSDNIFSSDVNSQIWENTFTLIYSINANNGDLFLNDVPDKKGRFDPNMFGANPLVGQTLNIIKMLQELSQSMINSDQFIEAGVIFPSLPEESFHSTKLAQKLCQELADPLVVSAKTLPHWCNYLVHNFPCLFSMEIRAMYMNTTAFGTSRANLSFGRPPTAASLRMARKLPKTSAEKLGGVSSAAGHGHKHTPGDVLSARSAYVAAGCLEKVGGSIKVKKSFGGGKTAKNVTAKKGGGTHSRSSGEASSKAQRNANQRELSSSNEKASIDSVSGISQQQQKSMSTTNLFDADQRKGRSSSAAFKQAASAESLQHQTPSLENLLSKARLHDYSIPEESMGSPNSGSPEPKNLSTFGNLPDFESRFDKRKGSQDMHGLSIAASSFTGGSQPVLNSSSFSRDRSQLSSSERLEPNQIESSIETINEVSQKAEDDGKCQQLSQNPNSRFETQSPMDDRAQDDEDEEAEILSRIKETEDFLDLFSASGGRILASETSDANDATLVEVDEPLNNKIKAEQMLKKVLDKSEDDGTNSGETSSVSQKEETHQNVPGTSGNSSQIQNIGSNIRVKLGNYAEVFRNMMQQVLESGDNSDIYDVDEFDNDIYEDELHLSFTSVASALRRQFFNIIMHNAPTLPTPMPFVRVMINGEHFCFLLDTGAESTLCGRRAHIRGRTTKDESKRITLTGIGGAELTDGVSVVTLEFASRHGSFVKKMTMSLHVVALVFDGAIGNDILDFSVINMRDKILTLPGGFETDIHKSTFVHSCP